MNCQHCGRPLSEVQFSQDKKYKSCPNCSKLNGQEHVYYPYPGNFGSSEKRVSVKNPDGPQSWCTKCRGNHNGPYEDGIKCSEL